MTKMTKYIRKNDEKTASANSIENQSTSKPLSTTIDNWLDDLITD